jgi:hypothetical protein
MEEYAAKATVHSVGLIHVASVETVSTQKKGASVPEG